MNPIKTKTITKRLPCTLTEKERLQFADEMANAAQEVESIELTRKSQMDQINSELKQAKARAQLLTGIVASKTEYRDVTVEVKLDYDKGKVIKTRTDTGELISERFMTDEEKQTSMLDDGEQFNED